MEHRYSVSPHQVITALVLCLVASSAQAQYVPPMGIPAPPFGINETAGAVTVTKTQADAVSGTLAAGTVMAVSGSHSNVSINASNCTVVAPCFIQGGVFPGTFSVTTGSKYLIVENAQLYNPDVASSDHIAFRYNNIVGDAAGGGIFGSNSSYVVAYGNLIHDIGQMVTATDIDRHCIPVGNNAHHYWILGNIFFHCGGDAVQVNAGAGQPQANVHHIYAGGNLCTTNRQTCFWAKESTDVVFSQNFCWHMRATADGSGNGDCIGSQYGSRRLVVLNNRIWDSQTGINLRSSNSTSYQSGAFIVGNVILDPYFPPGGHEPLADSSSFGGCIMVRTSGGSPSKHLIYFNTCVRPHGGIQIPAGAVQTLIGYNIIDHASSVAIVREGTTPTTVDTNVFYPSKVVSNVTTANDTVGDPKFTTTTDFRLLAGSAADNLGADVLNTIYTLMDGSTYLTNHGISLPSLGSMTPDAGAFTDLILSASVPDAAPGAASSRKRMRRGGL